jgi:hypothetical protein
MQQNGHSQGGGMPVSHAPENLQVVTSEVFVIIGAPGWTS